MRRNSMLVLALSAVLALGVAAVAAATSTPVRAGNLVLTVGTTVSPKKLPRKRLSPITQKIFGSIKTSDGTHPSALRELIVDIDKNGAVNAKGLPVCKGGQLEGRGTTAARRVCGKARVGAGRATLEIAFPEQEPLKLTGPVTLFNGGTKGRKTTLFIHAFITVPVPAAVVTTVTIEKIHKGRYGLHTISKIPVVAGGSGSALKFEFTIKKMFKYAGKKASYLEAKCPDGHFKAKLLKSLFKNEAHVEGVAPQTVLTSSLLIPCTPKG
jgi:hypothetical protein